MFSDYPSNNTLLPKNLFDGKACKTKEQEQAIRKWFDQEVRSKSRPATAQDYADWLQGWTAKSPNNKPVVILRNNFTDFSAITLTEDVHLNNLHTKHCIWTAHCSIIIVPKGVKVTGDSGGFEVFDMNDYSYDDSEHLETAVVSYVDVDKIIAKQ